MMAGMPDIAPLSERPACPAPHTRMWRQGKLADEGFPIEQISEHLDHGDCVVWADLCHPDHESFLTIAEELGLDPHAVEDAVSNHERPKLDRYGDNAFLTAYAVRLTDGGDQLESCKVSAFVLPRALITIRSEDWFEAERIAARWDQDSDLARYGVPALLHGLLDEIVDCQFDAIQRLDEEIEGLEEILFEDGPMPPEAQRRNFELRKSLVYLRRLVLPMRDLVVSLHRWRGGPEGEQALPSALEPYYQDLYDHVLRATEWADGLRDLVSTVFETNLSLQDTRLNTTMRRLSAWAAIIAVPTAITGFYGQNVPYPGFGAWHGFVVSAGLILLLSGGFYVYFRRRGWL
jgi:magnesium transporter